MDDRTEINIADDCEMVQCKKCVKVIPLDYATYCKVCEITYCSNACWYKSGLTHPHIKCLITFCINRATPTKLSNSYSSLPSLKN